MVSEEDKIVIKTLRIEKKWGAIKMIKEFPNKGWSITTLTVSLKQMFDMLPFVFDD